MDSENKKGKKSYRMRVAAEFQDEQDMKEYLHSCKNGECLCTGRCKTTDKEWEEQQAEIEKRHADKQI